jgi:hypothetical protein
VKYRWSFARMTGMGIEHGQKVLAARHEVPCSLAECLRIGWPQIHISRFSFLREVTSEYISSALFSS